MHPLLRQCTHHSFIATDQNLLISVILIAHAHKQVLTSMGMLCLVSVLWSKKVVICIV